MLSRERQRPAGAWRLSSLAASSSLWLIVPLTLAGARRLRQQHIHDTKCSSSVCESFLRELVFWIHTAVLSSCGPPLLEAEVHSLASPLLEAEIHSLSSPPLETGTDSSPPTELASKDY